MSGRLQEEFHRKDLSAGRVQTPVLGWIVKKTKETKNHTIEYLEITLENQLKIGKKMEKMRKSRIKEIIDRILRSEAEITGVETKETKLNPRPPYSTDSMLREASEKLKFNVKETMRLAQDLFETGLITYHRTDSIRVSNKGIKVAREYIEEKWGIKEFKARIWGKKAAHECIRPTRPIDPDRLRNLIAMGTIRPIKRLTYKHHRLYELIFKRFIASQMKAAKTLKQKTKIRILNWELETEGHIKILERGFTRIMPIRLIKSSEKGRIKIKDIKHWRTTTEPLYTEGEVIRQMKERKIGRPSTYAKTLSTLLDKRYIIISPRKKKLIATKLGEEVYRYLNQTFQEYVSEETTRRLEKLMDQVENGEIDYTESLKILDEQLRTILQKTKN